MYVALAKYAIIAIMSERRPEPLRKRVLQGSIYLTIRNGISMLLSLVGSLLVTRAIGPENYGLFMDNLFSFLSLQPHMSRATLPVAVPPRLQRNAVLSFVTYRSVILDAMIGRCATST